MKFFVFFSHNLLICIPNYSNSRGNIKILINSYFGPYRELEFHQWD